MGPASNEDTRKLRGEIMQASASTYSETVLTVLAGRYGAVRHGAKLLARHAKTSVKTASNWLQGLNAPSGESLIELMVHCEELAVEVNRLVEERRKQNADIRN